MQTLKAKISLKIMWIHTCQIYNYSEHAYVENVIEWYKKQMFTLIFCRGGVGRANGEGGAFSKFFRTWRYRLSNHWE